MRKSARTQIPPFFDNDPYIFNLKVVILANCIMILPSRYDRHIKDLSKKGSYELPAHGNIADLDLHCFKR